MPNAENLKPFKGGDDDRRNIAGRPPGTKNRSTIARKILEMKALYSDVDFKRLKELYPELEKSMTVEEMCTIIQVDKAIKDKDTTAYRALMDSAYGAPKHEVENMNVNYNSKLSLSKEEVNAISKMLEDEV